MTSLRRAANEGILVKGPRTLELLARVNTVVFDKTGTLTTGTLHVTRVVSYDRSVDEAELIRLSAAAEHGLSHPVARAVARLARERQVEVPPVTSTESSLGLGIDVRVEDRRVLIGSRRFMELRRVALEKSRSDETAAHAAGASPLFVAIDDRLAGMLVLQDQLRDDAPEAVRALRARQMKNVIMLSGDHPAARTVSGVLLGFAGLAFLITSVGINGSVRIGACAIIVFASACWSFGSWIQPRLSLPADPFVTTTYEMLAGGLALLVSGLLGGERIDVADYSPRSLIAWAYLVLFGTVIAFSAYVWVLDKAPISLVATYAYVNPVVAVFLGWVGLSEPITLPILTGGAVVIAAVAIVVSAERHHPHPQPNPPSDTYDKRSDT